MKKLKYIGFQTLLISFLMLCVITLEGVLNYFFGTPLSFSWYIPLSILIVSILCSLPTAVLLWLQENESTRRPLFSKLAPVLHFLLLAVIVMGGGYLFRWYSSFPYFCATLLSYIIIYALVWIITLSLVKKDDRLINEALKKIRDEE